MRILIVDDNPSDFELARIALKSMTNLELDYVEDFENVKKIFTPNRYAAVISDYNLAGILGTDILHYVKSLEPEIPFILFSGALGEELAIEVLHLGVTDYVLKDKMGKLPLALLRALKEADALKAEKRSFIKIKESEENFRKIFESIKDVYYQADLNGMCTMISPSAFSMFGYLPEEVMGKSLSLFYEDPEVRTKMLAEIQINGYVNNFEATIVAKNDSRVCVSANVNIMYDALGNPIGLQGIIRDVTDKKRNEEERIKRILAEHESAENQKLATELIISSNKLQDSIKYAKRLQDGIRSSVEGFNLVFENSFTIDYPKEILSGDFYWFNIKNKKNILALADCTGHGIPGALLSTLGYSMLNNIILYYGVTSPHQILTKLCHYWRKTFDKNNKENNNHDGMEISICSIDYENNIIDFAGMAGGVFFLSDGTLKEYKGTRTGLSCDYLRVSGNYLEIDIENYQISFKPGDRIYLSSDGYCDQFGEQGTKGRLTKKRLIDLIIGIQKYSMREQKELIADFFMQWKGKTKQIDDVLVIGIQL